VRRPCPHSILSDLTDVISPKFLGPGDEVEISITGIGTIKNKVMAVGKKPIKPQPSIMAASVLRTSSTRGLTSMSSGKEV
jgi:hypothetical protein